VRGSKRWLGVDYGSVRIGLAISDPDGQIASPLTTYQRRDRERDAAYFRRLVAERDIGRILVGLPLHLDGREGAKAYEARWFGGWLQQVTGLAVTYYDERFTTVEAESALWEAGLTHQQRKERRDRVAAQILLQTYLDAGCPPEPTAGPLDE
jgi:putative Holliday junction resolvase